MLTYTCTNQALAANSQSFDALILAAYSLALFLSPSAHVHCFTPAPPCHPATYWVGRSFLQDSLFGPALRAGSQRSSHRGLPLRGPGHGGHARRPRPRWSPSPVTAQGSRPLIAHAWWSRSHFLLTSPWSRSPFPHSQSGPMHAMHCSDWGARLMGAFIAPSLKPGAGPAWLVGTPRHLTPSFALARALGPPASSPAGDAVEE